MGINIDAGSARLFEKLVQVFQIVPGNNDEGTFLRPCALVSERDCRTR